MSEASGNPDTRGEVRSAKISAESTEWPDYDGGTLPAAVDMSSPQSPPFRPLSPVAPSTALDSHAMAATVENYKDERDRPFRASPGPAASMASPSHADISSPATNVPGDAGERAKVPSVTPRERPKAKKTQGEDGHAQSPRQQRRPGAPHLDTGSPLGPRGNDQDTPNWAYQNPPKQSSPSMKSPSSSIPSNYPDVFSEHPPDGGSYASWSPDHPGGGSPAFVKLNGNQPPGPPHLQQPPFSGPFGGPEVTGGTPGMPQFPPPAMPQFWGAEPPGPPPRTDNLSLSGYQLLAAKLAGGVHGPPVRSIYRRFEALNHRILLHLQDEITELEDYLHGLDMADTQQRRFSGGILPASRRQESMNNGDLFRRKKEILGNVGYKLVQYNQVMTSFKDTQQLLPPTMADIQDYRHFVATNCTVVEDETRFLDSVDDLVSLAGSTPPPPNPRDLAPDEALTPMPRPAPEAGFPPGRPMSPFSANSAPWRVPGPPPAERVSPAALVQLAAAMFVALLVPVMTFAVIPGFVGRMTVVLLVGLGVAAAVVQSGLLKLLSSDRGVLDCIICVGVYGGVMAVIAGTFG